MTVSTRRVPYALLACLAVAVDGADATIDTDWVPVDEIVSNPDVSTTDPEFDPVTGFAAWQFGPNARVASGRLLVARIDPQSGDLLDPVSGVPINAGGRGLEIDRDLVPRDLSKNGPEFAFAEFGSRLVYTRFNELGEPSLAQAVFDGADWFAELLPNGSNRITPEGSKEIGDLSPRIAYFGFVRGSSGQTERRLGVRIIDLPFTETISPTVLDGASFLPRDSVLLATSTPAGGVRQVFAFDYGTGDVAQITSDPAAKLQSPEPWEAPELAGEVVFTIGARGGGESVARIYRRDAGGSWRIFTQVRSPDPDKPFLSTPQPFVFEGVSYLAFRSQPNPGQNLGADLWVVNVLAPESTRVYRRISATAFATRYDQEPFITADGPVVYYTQVLDSGLQQVRRCRTGILPGAGGP